LVAGQALPSTGASGSATGLQRCDKPRTLQGALLTPPFPALRERHQAKPKFVPTIEDTPSFIASLSRQVSLFVVRANLSTSPAKSFVPGEAESERFR
jgi:hypothetical protein